MGIVLQDNNLYTKYVIVPICAKIILTNYPEMNLEEFFFSLFEQILWNFLLAWTNFY